MKKKQTNNKWFVKVRGSYLPCNWIGWLLYLPFISFLGATLTIGLTHQETWFDVFMTVFPRWIAAAVVMTWIASQKS